MKKLPFRLGILILILSCEKVPLFDDEIGYFKGTVAKEYYESAISDNKFTPNITFERYSSSCDSKSYLHCHFVKKGTLDKIYERYGTTFFIDKLDKLDGDKYKKFADVYDEQGDFDTYCDKLPAVLQGVGRNYGYYKHVHTKDTYLKITGVTDEYVSGCFDVLFVSKDFLEKGIKSGQDSMRIKCDKFIAIIQ
jgi:hypothetical protein